MKKIYTLLDGKQISVGDNIQVLTGVNYITEDEIALLDNLNLIEKESYDLEDSEYVLVKKLSVKLLEYLKEWLHSKNKESLINTLYSINSVSPGAFNSLILKSIQHLNEEINLDEVEYVYCYMHSGEIKKLKVEDYKNIEEFIAIFKSYQEALIAIFVLETVLTIINSEYTNKHAKAKRK